MFRKDLLLASYAITNLIIDCPWLVYEFCAFLPYSLRIHILYFMKENKQEISYPSNIAFQYEHRHKAKPNNRERLQSVSDPDEDAQCSANAKSI